MRIKRSSGEPRESQPRAGSLFSTSGLSRPLLEVLIILFKDGCFFLFPMTLLDKRIAFFPLTVWVSMPFSKRFAIHNSVFNDLIQMQSDTIVWSGQEVFLTTRFSRQERMIMKS